MRITLILLTTGARDETLVTGPKTWLGKQGLE